MRVAALAFLLFAAVQDSDGRIVLPTSPSLSPDGSKLAFAWRGDIWVAATSGGVARALTQHPADDSEPRWSPDGKEIAFTSDRKSGRQVWVMAADGGRPQQLTFHTAGFSLVGWYPDGASLLVRGTHDSFWRDSLRLFKVSRTERTAHELVCDDYAEEAHVGPDGASVVFVREGGPWWRKNYRGSQAGQLWMHGAAGFRKLLAEETECRWPLWRPDGKAVYYAGGTGSWNLRELDLETGKSRALTSFTDDSVVLPTISKDGSTIVFRKLFDFYRHDVKSGKTEKIELREDGDALRPPRERRTLASADHVAFTNDGLEIAFIAGGDVWVMDTVLKEPVQVTHTPEYEHGLAFTADGNGLLYCGAFDIFRAERKDAAKYWWQNGDFTVKALTNDADRESDLKLSPDGSRVAFLKGRGDLWTMKPDGNDAKRFLASWNGPDFDWSPDGKWLAYAVSDNDFNRDVWIAPLDGSREPFNVSRHPDNEGDPVWSPDGRCLAYLGQRRESETDVFYVWLRKEDDEKAKRDRTLEEAIDKMKKGRKPPAKPVETPKEAPKEPPKKDEQDPPKEEKPAEAEKPKPAPAKKDDKPLIDFDGLHERVRRVSNPDVSEGNLLWSSDSKKLCFTATVAEVKALFAIDFPEAGKPKQFAAKTGTQARWLKEGNQIAWLADGVPGTVSSTGAVTAFTFSARHEFETSAKYRAAFVEAWRIMRDTYYDERMGNNDWDAIRTKYEPAAAAAVDARSIEVCINLMLGELNGSHLGFRANSMPWRSPDGWDEQTPHFGVRFDRSHGGKGWKIRDVLPGGPAEKGASRLEAGEVILKIDGVEVDGRTDVTRFNGLLDREIRLTVAKEGKEREVGIRPMSWGAVPGLLYKHWIQETRKQVGALSKGTLGYIHIRGMDWMSFDQFEADLFAEGSGKDGLLIDVRENGGGFTADHLLTILCQPQHAVTVPRGGGEGYPQDRRVYATWTKPIVILCNQNSFSNAEIITHAVKTLKRGKVVGVPTAGGVISTGGATVMDVGSIRTPGRGWFLRDTGEDLELNGAVPDVVLWPEPGQMPAGKDVQLEKAVDVLMKDVADEKSRPKPVLKKASERKP